MPYAPIPSAGAQGLYYEDTGGDGPIVVFSHGFLMDRTMFAPQLAALQGLYRCITWDQRGHGRTATHRLSPFDFYDSANDLSDLLDFLGIKGAVLVGMSQGGFLTLRAALTNPNAASALILLDTEADVMAPCLVPKNEGLLAAWIKGGLSEELADIIAAQIIGPVLPGWGQIPAWINVWTRTAFVNLIPSFNALIMRDNITAFLGAISQPALVVHGEEDKSIPFASGQAMAKALPHATFASIPNAGHAACLTHSAEVNPYILNFLAQVAPARPAR